MALMVAFAENKTIDILNEVDENLFGLGAMRI